jgi:hypothetical protein
MESFITISVNTQNTNMFCVVGTHVTRYGSSSSRVDGLEQESLFKFGVDIEDFTRGIFGIPEKNN